ncbi:MAG: 5-(carboxyamino)imidazole ribonucleotide synthase [Deltaproteobacteria bacterium]|nr:5-(carboxyamino)imidazole ribonucleotide synthase [Deltaproteobacteria bacterium]MBP6833798.1 5-(carboxyamino)imidazole ribonucleotide synthase [Deltaproteobacteria bacterium]
MSVILPGATIGILGGGQLGRMTAMAARPLGYKVHVLDPDPSCAARFVVERCLTAAFDDDFAAADLARHCAVVTLEIEKIAPESMAAVRRYAPVRPGSDVLSVVQDRGRQRKWLSDHGFPTVDWRRVASVEELVAAVAELGPKSFVKSCTGGYDGRGQARMSDAAEAAKVWASLGSTACVVERAAALEAELSVLVARTPSGRVAVHPVAQNHHDHGVLTWSVIPAGLPEKVLKEAAEIARGIAEEMRVEGLLVVELFLTAGGVLRVNELAPRPHNSFHATEVGCVTSQFEQAVRAVCDLPLGSTEVVRPAAIHNLLGDLWVGDQPPRFERALEIPGVRLHLYGKRVARPGRKMGHLSALGQTSAEATARVIEAWSRVQG